MTGAMIHGAPCFGATCCGNQPRDRHRFARETIREPGTLLLKLEWRGLSTGGAGSCIQAMSPACPSGSVERPAWAVGAVAWFAGLGISVGLAGMWTGTRDPGRLRVIPWRAFPAPPGTVVRCPGGGRRCRGRGGTEDRFRARCPSGRSSGSDRRPRMGLLTVRRDDDSREAGRISRRPVIPCGPQECAGAGFGGGWDGAVSGVPDPGGPVERRRDRIEPGGL